jgi:Lon protease-like protein
LSAQEPLAAILEEIPAEVPLFPLPNHVLLPGVPTPYRVFEPRYLSMVKDLMHRPESDRWLSVPLLEQGWEDGYGDAPAFMPVATVGRITQCRRLANGEFLIIVEGVERIHLAEYATTALYRVARVQVMPDTGDTSEAELAQVIDTIQTAVISLVTILGDRIDPIAALIGQKCSPKNLVYRLTSLLMPNPWDRQSLLEVRCELKRAQQILDALSLLVARSGGRVRPGQDPALLRQ